MRHFPAFLLRKFSKEKIQSSNPDIVTFLNEAGVFASKGEAKKMIAAGGLSLNKQKVSDATAKVNMNVFINEKYLFVQKGKTNFI